jgi:hypothetical protein
VDTLFSWLVIELVVCTEFLFLQVLFLVQRVFVALKDEELVFALRDHRAELVVLEGFDLHRVASQRARDELSDDEVFFVGFVLHKRYSMLMFFVFASLF